MLVGLALLIWAAVFGIRHRGRWDHQVTKGFWLRLLPGWAALCFGTALDPANPNAGAVAAGGTGIGLIV